MQASGATRHIQNRFPFTPSAWSRDIFDGPGNCVDRAVAVTVGCRRLDHTASPISTRDRSQNKLHTKRIVKVPTAFKNVAWNLLL